ncbi:MAG TPA: hypothetical protein VEV44_06610 [Pseudoneobacillus sp.]|nr:hypothetical protein [Pseudoneobacillus sp.]
MKKLTKVEAVLWSAALPGFGQLLVGQYFKGAIFIFLEFLININSHFNSAIMYSFLWEIDKAMQVTDYQWLMFYPCLYMFAMWDAYRQAMPEGEKLTFLPFVFAAYFLTVGLMYSPKLEIFNIKFGPVFLPMFFFLPLGLLVGYLIRVISLKIGSVRKI